MLADLSSLLIVGNSGRAMAQSAARGGFAVTVLDGFCDQDTQAVADCRQIRLDANGLNHVKLLSEIESLPSRQHVGIVYGAGLEGASSLLNRLPGHCLLLGNDPAVLDMLCNPRCYFTLLDSLQIPYPEVRFSPPESTTATDWLIKRADSSGGMGVAFWSQEPPMAGSEYYYQRFLHGSVMSALFIADGNNHRIIGYNSLRTTSPDRDTPFLYGGALGQVSLDDSLCQQVEFCVEKLVYTLGLRGVNSLDFVLSDGEVYVLDLNTRPTATLELYEHQTADGWMKHHVQACLGNLPDGLQPTDSVLVHGHRVVYAPRAVEIPEVMDWPGWIKDRPKEGTRIARGEPVCSIFTNGLEADVVEARLRQYHREILAMISSRSIFE
ncbi:MAG: ATP-grasp domain-containing protein [Gammaproteobacteria bacterium]|nr:ATP-grasp domain-containing protein [Gammaproteobacteria bacterium]